VLDTDYRQLLTLPLLTAAAGRNSEPELPLLPEINNLDKNSRAIVNGVTRCSQKTARVMDYPLARSNLMRAGVAERSIVVSAWIEVTVVMPSLGSRGQIRLLVPAHPSSCRD